MTEEEKQKKMERNKEVYDRFRSYFPSMSDRKFALLVNLKPSSIMCYVNGRNSLDILGNSLRYPDFDWAWILTGRDIANKGELQRELLVELRQTHAEMTKIADRLQKLEEKTVDIK